MVLGSLPFQLDFWKAWVKGPLPDPEDHFLTHIHTPWLSPQPSAAQLVFLHSSETLLINVSNDSLLSNPVLLLSPHYIGNIWHCWPHPASWKPLFQPLSGSVPFFLILPIPGMFTFCSVLGCAHFCLPPSPPPAFLFRGALLPLNAYFAVSAGHTKFLFLVMLFLWSTTSLLNHLLTFSFDNRHFYPKTAGLLGFLSTTGLPSDQLPS